MACRTYGNDDCNQNSNGLSISDVKELIAESKKESVHNELSVMLCSLCTYLETQNYNFALNPAVDVWWEEHKKHDRIRVEQEMMDAAERIKNEFIQTARNVSLKEATKDLLLGSNLKPETIELLKQHKFL